MLSSVRAVRHLPLPGGLSTVFFNNLCTIFTDFV